MIFHDFDAFWTRMGIWGVVYRSPIRHASGMQPSVPLRMIFRGRLMEHEGLRPPDTGMGVLVWGARRHRSADLLIAQ